MGVAVIAACGSAALVLPLTAPASAEVPGPDVTFEYTGNVQTWTVPDGVTKATFFVDGAGGGMGGAGAKGGEGAAVRATLAVTPGEVIDIYVGGAGADGSAADPFFAGAGGWPSGTVGAQGGFAGPLLVGGGGGGGGASAVGDYPFAALVIAGGGGGGGGGAGAGAGGASSGNGGGSVGGHAGTQTAGGLGGNSDTPSGGPGNGGSGHVLGGGGGGGGYFGGGGGGNLNAPGSPGSGGGGGSNYVPPSATDVLIKDGNDIGDGDVAVGYEPPGEGAPGTKRPPRITGDPAVGRTLTCDPGSYSGASVKLSFAWLRDAVAIAGARSATYKPTAADVGHKLACRVTAADAGGATVATSGVVTVTAAASSGTQAALQQFLGGVPGGTAGTRLLRGITAATFTAPRAGRVRLYAYLPAAAARAAKSSAAKTKPVVLAAAARTYTRPGRGKLHLKLTAAGRAELARAKRLRVLLVATFVPARGRTATARRTITVGGP